MTEPSESLLKFMVMSVPAASSQTLCGQDTTSVGVPRTGGVSALVMVPDLSNGSVRSRVSRRGYNPWQLRASCREDLMETSEGPELSQNCELP